MEKERRFRLVVKSAEEAVHLLKKNFGDKARVVSVKQVEGKGLARFLCRPRLEIIAVLGQDREVETESTPEVIEKESVPVQAEPLVQEVKRFDEKDHYNGGTLRERMEQILEKSGFAKLLIEEFLENEAMADNLTVQQGLNLFFNFLQKSYEHLSLRPVGRRIALLGPSGVGKTLGICKLLAQEVFIFGRRPIVIKLDSEKAKGQEALNIFCEVLGLVYYQEGVDIVPSNLANCDLFFDCEGVNFFDDEELISFNAKLDQWQVDTRVLVLNALYDHQFLDKCFSKVDLLKLTHCVFTHLDENINASKLWKYILKGGMSPFFSFGQNLTADFTQQVLPYLMNKTRIIDVNLPA